MLKKMTAESKTKTDISAASDESVSVAPGNATIDELERLRDILFGSQSRTLDKRLADLEAELRKSRQELTDLVNDKVGALTETMNAQTADIRREFGEKLDKQEADHSAQVRTMQKDLTERLERQASEQVTQLDTAQKGLANSIEKLAADFPRQIRETHKELSSQIEKMSGEQAERVRTLQNESRQRNDNLRQELLNIAASLEGKKASREDLGQMLMELGLRLRKESSDSVPS